MIPDAIAHQARYPAAAGPEPFPESGAVRVSLDVACVLLTPMPTVTLIEDVRAEPDEIPSALEAVRGVLREHGRSQAAWTVPETSPAHAALIGAGLAPYTDPPLGPHATAMALVEAPRGTAGEGVEVREAETLEDYVAVGELAADLFDMSAEDREGIVSSTARRYELRKTGRTAMRTYLAYVDGELAGEAQSSETALGTNLSGSSVRPQARGRGVYRALVAARWDHAVERGLPALTVQAGPMSQPILARLGFQVVDELAILCDRF